MSEQQPQTVTREGLPVLALGKAGDEDFATLCRIVGVKDPGPDVTRMDVSIDWVNQKVETRFTFLGIPRG
jgi:hypothetical protein